MMFENWVIGIWKLPERFDLQIGRQVAKLSQGINVLSVKVERLRSK